MPKGKKQETLSFQTEVKQLLHLMIHSLYSNKEIFLRELISNASDAADKLRFEALQNDGLYEEEPDLKIWIEYNKGNKTITVIDNGIGMSRDEVVDHLGTIAKSGTKQFFDSLTGDQSKDSQLIGQFGVGFYSAFIVAKKIEVLTRRAGLPKEQGVHWSSSGEEEYSVETVARNKRGTKIILHLRDDMNEFLDGYRLRGIINKYSDHISTPIIMLKEGKDEKGEETVNSATALWMRNKKDIKQEEYHAFYKHIAHDFEDPLAYTHNKVEGKFEYTNLLYIPAKAPFDLWNKDQKRGLKLYVRRVFIMENVEHFLPLWLRFVKGVVDSNDLPLNISREILQQNKIIDSIRAGCVKKILTLLKGLAKKEPEKYIQFWTVFGQVLKEGVVDNSEYKDDLAGLFRFASTMGEGDKQEVALKDYVERMQTGQKNIYYVTADNYATAKNSPHLEIFREKKIEVLLLTDPIDEWVTSHLSEYEGKTMSSVTKGELDLDDIDKEDNKKKIDKNAHASLIKRIKDILDDKVKDVRVTHRLTHSPACLVADEGQTMGRHLETILKASGQAIPESKPILEINPTHPIITRLDQETDEDHFKEWSHIIFDQALLSEGGQPDDPAKFVGRLNKLIVELTKD